MKNNFTHKIAICGATGFIGSHLRRHLEEAGHHVVPLGRELFTGEIQRLLNLMDGCDTVINVAGLTIDHRWSPAYKRQLYDSRVGTTRQIVEAIARTSSVRCWICASAVGYYPSAGCHDDRVPQPSGSDFLAGLCRDWEAEAARLPILSARSSPVSGSFWLPGAEHSNECDVRSVTIWRWCPETVLNPFRGSTSRISAGPCFS